MLADRVAKAPGLAGLDGLAAAMLIAAVVITPIGGRQATGALADPMALLAGIGVGLCSSVIPYVADQLALARLPRATYALMVSLLPATATVVGILVLTQLPSAPETARGGARHRGRRAAPRAVTPAHGKVQESYGVLLTMTELTRPRTRRPSIALAAATALAVFGISAVTPAIAGSGSPVIKAGKAGGKTVVVNGKGRTLYVLSPETAKHVLCKSSCLPYWPAVTTTKAAKLKAGAGVKGKLGKLNRGGGKFQVTLRGLPLYTYIGDSARGDATGEGVTSFGGTWHVVRAAG